MATIDRASSSVSSPSVRKEGEAIAEEEDTLFVAVSRHVAESESVLRWALQNRGNSQICIIHVHPPDKEISIGIGVPVPIDQINNKIQIEDHRVKERKRLSEKLDKHLKFCSNHGVKVQKIYIEMDSIQDGIVKLISDNKIKKLAMGAASDKRYSKDMIEILSEKAKYVRQHAPGYCHIWFVCKKFLIHTREATEKSAPSYEIDGLMDAQNSFARDRGPDEYEMPMLNRISSHSTYHSSLSGPSTPDLSFPQVMTDAQKGIDAWLLSQQRQRPYDLTPSSTVESRIENSDLMVEQLKRRLKSAMEQVENYKKERDNAIKQVEEVRHQLMEGASCSEFPTFHSLLEIEKEAYKFDPSLKIGEDAYGNIYKGVFSFEASVKVPHPSSSSSSQLFKQEVEIMCKVRHPNVVNLISICPESQVLIYEYCGNGNLEDRLNSNVEGSPILWQTRLKIAVELCSVLIFLHSQKPHPIIHGDIRPENIHLDSKYSCKLNDFTSSIAISSGQFSLENNTVTSSRAISYAYTDPEYFPTGELTTKSDVYSYGIILLRLLTGKPAVRLTKQVQSAAETDELGSLLDPSAGWPPEQAKQLAALALRCCEMTSHNRPDLEPDVWKALESIKGLYD